MAYNQKSPFKQTRFDLHSGDLNIRNREEADQVNKIHGQVALEAASWAIPGGAAVKAPKIAGKFGKIGNFFKNLISKKKPTNIKNPPPYIPEELPIYKGVQWNKSSQAKTDIFDLMKQKGKTWDDANINFSADMFRGMPTIDRRKMVDINPGGGLPSMRFYKSIGEGDKGYKIINGVKVDQKKPGHWTPLEGYGDQGWFIKGEGWDEGYGSKTFKNIGKVINEMGY